MSLQFKKNWRRTPDERSCLGPSMLLPCSGPWGLDIVRLLRSSEPKVFYPICSFQTQGILNTSYYWISVNINQNLSKHIARDSSMGFLLQADSLRLVEFSPDFRGPTAGHHWKCFGNSWTACFVNVGNITQTFWHFLTHPEARHGARFWEGEPVGYCTSAPIHAVAESGDVNLAKQLLSAGLDPEEPHSSVGVWAEKWGAENRRSLEFCVPPPRSHDLFHFYFILFHYIGFGKFRWIQSRNPKAEMTQVGSMLRRQGLLYPVRLDMHCKRLCFVLIFDC